MSDIVNYDLDGHVATITYNRPEALNAIDSTVRAGLNRTFARFRDEEDAWVAIVTGAGRVVPAADLMPEARRLADRLLAAAPLAARATKEMATRARNLPLTDAIRMGETMRRLVGATADAAEGLAAHRDRRPPVWTGT